MNVIPVDPATAGDEPESISGFRVPPEADEQALNDYPPTYPQD